MIRGGEWTRSVPDVCTVDGSVGVIGDDDPEAIRAAVGDAIHDITSRDTWLAEHPPELEWLPMSLLPAMTAADHPFVRIATEATARISGRKPNVLPLLGASDLRFYARYFGIPGTHLGPGSMRRGHGPNEFVEVEQVLRATKIVAATVRAWCGAA
jgi:acetylornithine deacetylase